MIRFLATGLASPQLPLRVLNMFAQRDLTIEKLTLERYGKWFLLVLEQTGVNDSTAILIAEKLRAMIEVSEVVLEGEERSVQSAFA